MKQFGLLLLAGCLAGCDYTVPLAGTPELPMDPALAGVWSRTRPEGEPETLLVLPLDKRECLVSFPAGRPDAMFGRVCLARADGRTLAQVRWIGTARGKQPDTARVYQYADFSVSSNRLSVRLLNGNVVAREAASAADLARAIAGKSGDPDLFREALVFAKVKP